MLPNANVGKAVAGSTIALVRLAYDLFAAPVTLGLVAFAWALGPSRLSWLSVLCFVVIHFYTGESGVDAFGPAHYYELALPVLVLSGIGYAHGARWARHWRPAMPPGWLAAVAAVILLVSLAGYAPVRLAAAKRIADAVNLPADAVRTARVSNAIVFSAGLFVPQECSAPTRHFVYFRPNNDPWLTNDVLWANHLGWEVDQELLRHFPSRTGYLMTWKDCRPHLMRITS